MKSTLPTVANRDAHSFAKPEMAVIKHLDLDIDVDMDAHIIRGTASFDIIRTSGDHISFDTDNLVIIKVTDENGQDLEHDFWNKTPMGMGQPLCIRLPNGVNRVNIMYRTNPGAKALQWLAPAQTTDKQMPFLFTQGQAILTRSWIPIQDSPGIRFTYNAKVRVPKELMAVMSATNPVERNTDGIYEFKMDKPIPAYLIALAVGDLVFKPLSDRTGLYGERSVIEKAVWEFADIEKMVSAAEDLYGPYRWGRYDVLVTPTSFPFGGMENPMLTFVTPTIIAGDRSLTSLVAHELAHSWSGNLVTNATWNDFWLNEGFTVYFERRIMEKLYGKDYSDMLAVLGHQILHEEIEEIWKGEHPYDTCLRLDLAGRNPDDGMTHIAYEKGYAFLRLIESRVGRSKFDSFVSGYFDKFAFQSMTTEMFVRYLKSELLDPVKADINLHNWLYQPGLPEDTIIPTSERFTQVKREIWRYSEAVTARELETQGWSAFEWMHFLQNLPKSLSFSQMVELDQAFHFSESGNSELVSAWLLHCIRNEYVPGYKKLGDFLVTNGRRKFLSPLYAELMKTDEGKDMAMEIYSHARPNYHSISARSVDEILGIGS